MTTQWQNNWSM